ncbi:MAG: methyltransferase [Gammaproteobacteria bacterium]|nr:methyltransferase [Gammaproteobacteria bacterium]
MPVSTLKTYTIDELDQWFTDLEAVLIKLSPLWRPQPYKQERPEWCESHPAMTAALLSLTDAQHHALRQDDVALCRWLSNWIEEFGAVNRLTQLHYLEQPIRIDNKHLDWAIPGRKWQQITRFVSALENTQQSVMEWCGGKGHLGRVIGAHWDVSVMTLEINQALCDDGQRLAKRANVQQVFQRVDVLSKEVPKLNSNHAIALHACGELHRQLIRKSIAENVTALDIAPCCYHLGAEENYQPFSADAGLTLGRDDLRLSVTETVTSSGREVKQRDIEMAWKLGFNLLRKEILGEQEYQSLRPIDKAWLKNGFHDFCLKLAKREAMELPATIDWCHFEQAGWSRQSEVMRLSLLRHAIRRPMELWLVLDMARFLQTHGYAIRLATFCLSSLTPRNILLSARKI